MAQNIHLVDLFTGWGRGTGEVLHETFRRLHAIHPTAQVELVDLGFLKYFPAKIMWPLIAQSESPKSSAIPERIAEFSIFQSHFRGRSALLAHGPDVPIEFRVRWTQDGLGEVRRNVFLHFMDFNDPECIEKLEAELTRHGKTLAGIVVTGSAFPKELHKFIDVLPARSSALLEVFCDDDEQTTLLKALRSDPRFDVRLVDLKSIMRVHQDYVVTAELYKVSRVRIQ